MQNADGVIFATPVYAFQISGLMKVFIDRHSYICHRSRFFRQKALILTSASAVGNREVLNYLYIVVRIWGFSVTARVGIISHAMMGPLPADRVQENEQKLQVVAGTFFAALQGEKCSRPGLFDVMVFHMGESPYRKDGRTGSC